MAKILLLGAGTQALAIIRGLAKDGQDVCMLTGEHGNYADVSKYISKCFYCHIPTMSDEFLQYVEELIAKKGIDVLIPMGDESAEFLSKNKERLHKIVKFNSPDYEYFLEGYDKNKLMSLCQEKGYPHPQTIDLTKTSINDEKLQAFPYPAMLKPNCTTGGRGMVVVNSHEELLNKYPGLHKQYGDYHLQRFIREGGRQVKIQLCVDKDGKLIAHSAMHKVRWYPVRGGSSCCAVSIEEPKMTEVCLNILHDIHWEGFADFDLIEDPDTHELLIMEINPRLPACLGTTVHAGVEWGQILVDQALGQEPKTYKYKTGVVLRHLGFDVLWFLKSSKRFSTKPSWFRFFGKNVFYQDMDGWTDQKPFLIGTYHNIKKLFDPSFKEAKSI
jgi:predicted ATP-grasp superfamily ATP-dependent carboligase